MDRVDGGDDGVAFDKLAQKVICEYSRRKLAAAARNSVAKRFSHPNLKKEDGQFLNTIAGMVDITSVYSDPVKTDRVLESVDLAAIYELVDEMESLNPPAKPTKAAKPDEKKLQYEDYVVKATLLYFKTNFFKWVNKPKCPDCGKDSENIVAVGVLGPPAVNPYQITRIENYTCQTCNVQVHFSRYNDPAKLLDTKEGRCGEWVNCFMLILHALLGPEAMLRYVWNREDHVWCEYYSRGLGRWIHLDPCEGSFDQPYIYCENWGKRMSWCIGFGDSYVIDLSDKYILRKDRQISKSEAITCPAAVATFIKYLNQAKLVKHFHEKIDILQVSEEDKYLQLYYHAILPRNKETLMQNQTLNPTKSSDVPIGRQSGSTEWVEARGEGGSS